MSEKRTVKVYFGEGPDRIELGEAEIETMPDGSMNVSLFDGNLEFTGYIPAPPWKDDDNAGC